MVDKLMYTRFELWQKCLIQIFALEDAIEVANRDGLTFSVRLCLERFFAWNRVSNFILS
jgi:hypothetical protein